MYGDPNGHVTLQEGDTELRAANTQSSSCPSCVATRWWCPHLPGPHLTTELPAHRAGRAGPLGILAPDLHIARHSQTQEGVPPFWCHPTNLHPASPRRPREPNRSAATHFPSLDLSRPPSVPAGTPPSTGMARKRRRVAPYRNWQSVKPGLIAWNWGC